MKGIKIFLWSIYIVLIILILLSLIRCNKDSEPQLVEDPESVEQAQEIGGSGGLKITLLWDFEADIDLHVTEPNGFTIYFSNDNDPETGGELDHDNTEGGIGSAENIFWTNPPSGTYEVNIHYYQKKTLIARSGECTVVIFREGRSPEVRKVRMTHKGQFEHIATFTI